jgi:uncharacterized protein YyaL (SSP411 family)
MIEASLPLSAANRLESESSPYLRSASHQPVQWYPWGEEAFSAAQKENKPILLDIGAVWCHWCHVMDTESYENEATARIINENYVPVKVDRDERPDVDSRYQAAVSAISGQGGWPLTAFLTADGKAFFGGTYFPPEDRHGRMSFPKILALLAKTYKGEPEKILQNAEQIKQSLQNRWVEIGQSEALSDSMLNDALAAILDQVDMQDGGFGSAPKFPHCSAIELLLSSHDRLKDKRMLDAVTVTLRKMARGGIYDQLGGGFHRYSTDKNWIVPHFEKMLYDNASLLTNYIHTYQATGDEFFREIALDIIRFTQSILSDREHGGFFGSQDADVVPGDDGSYFTWSLEETKRLLNDDEFKVAQILFGVSSTGHMHDDRTQNVLHLKANIEEIALTLCKPIPDVILVIDSAKKKMLEARLERKSPYVDKTIYASWNGMMISAYFEAFKIFHREDCRDFALKTLQRILDEHSNSDGSIAHRATSLGPEGFLDDQMEIANALLQAFEVTTEPRYLEEAELIVRQTIDLFGDQEHGGFFDIPARQVGRGLLSIATKPIQDSPVGSANSVAISVLNKLGILTSQPTYGTFAEKSLNCFSGLVTNYGIFASRFFLSLDEFLYPPPHVAIVSDPADEKGKDLLEAAIGTYRPGKTVAVYEPSPSNSMPELLRSSVQSYSRPAAYVCSRFSCAPPSYDRSTLISTIQMFGRA